MKDGEDPGTLMTDRAFDRLLALLRDGSLAAGAFVSMPGLCDELGFPLAATREAVKRAEARGLVSIRPKRGVMVMAADAATTRDCLDLRAMLDQEGARRLVAQGGGPGLAALAEAHRAVLAAARHAADAALARRALATDLSLHDALGAGLANPLAAAVYGINRDRIAVIQNSRPFVADRIVSAMEEHLAILDALADGDAEAAVAAIDHHHRMTRRWWGVGG
jgi:DNA-binding GntR family transcriptional regulator